MPSSFLMKWSAALLLLASLTGCPPPAQECSDDSPCPTGQQCNSAGICEVAPCACGAEEACIAETCVPRACPQTLPDGGTFDQTCMEGTGCIDGACRTEGCPAECDERTSECAFGA